MGAPRYNPPRLFKEAIMRRSLGASLVFVLTVVLLAGPALAQGIVWWEHSNPPHNNYSKELVADWNKTHPNNVVEYEFFAMTPYFKEAGLDPDKDYPRTWEDIGRVGQKLVKMQGSTMTREGFDFAMHSSAWTMWYLEGLTRQYGGSILDRAGKKCTANSDAGVKAMQVRSMYVHKYKISDPTVSLATNALPADDLPKGRVSMFITHAGSVAQFGPKVMEDMKVVPFPQVNPQKPVSIIYGFALAVNPHLSEAKQ